VDGIALPQVGSRCAWTDAIYCGARLRDGQIAASNTDPSTTMRYERAWQKLDRHRNYILAAHTASGT
jgi:integrase/recombinase XerD